MNTSNKSNNSNVAYGTGRRKESIARVWLKCGSGKFIVNRKNLAEYFVNPTLQAALYQPFIATETNAQFDILSTVKGGGLSGQSSALQHGISRALAKLRADLHKTLRKQGFLTRDSRVVERKKYGRKKARKKFQFSKR